MAHTFSLHVIFLIVVIYPNCLKHGFSTIFSTASYLETDSKIKPIRYTLGEDSVSRDEAQSRCRKYHAELASIRSLDDIKSMKAFLDREPNGNKFWIGGSFRNKDECSKKPFEANCWFWDTMEGEIDVNPDFILFTEDSKARQPNVSSSMILLKRDPLKVDFEEKSSIRVFICDHVPSIPRPSNCTCVV